MDGATLLHIEQALVNDMRWTNSCSSTILASYQHALPDTTTTTQPTHTTLSLTATGYEIKT